MDKGSTLETPLLSKSEVIGNAFVQAHPFSLQQLVNSLQIFILAGHETTAHTIANAIYLLAMYPEYQVKLQKEIDSILGDSDHNLTSYETHFDAFSSGWIAAIMVYFPTHSHHNYRLREKIVRNPPPHSRSDCHNPPYGANTPHLPSRRRSEAHHTPPWRRIHDPNDRLGSQSEILDSAREN